MVSIVVPVYNTEKFLHKCINSIMAQSLQQWELILIDDGSTDNSGTICKEFALNDSRIKYIYQNNSGPGNARNNALKHCSGDFVTFIDSDDWVSSDYLFELVNGQQIHDADIVVCQYQRTKKDSEEVIPKKNFFPESKLYIRDSNLDKILGLSFISWGKLFKTNLLLNEDKIFSDEIRLCEDYASIPYIFIMATKVVVLNKHLYVWRDRSSSLTHELCNVNERIEAIELLMKKLKDKGIFESYKDSLQRFALRRANYNYRAVTNLVNNISYDFAKRQNLMLTNIFDDSCYLSYPHILAIGSHASYIAGKIVSGVNNQAELMDYCGFSSVIGIMAEYDENMKYSSWTGTSLFRSRAVDREFTKKIQRMSITEFSEYDYIILDFLDERFNVGKYDNYYFTLSDAFLECKGINNSYSIIDRMTEELQTIWEASCKKFAEHITKSFDEEKIILIRTKLSEHYFDNGRLCEFSNIDYIKKFNSLVDKYYDYFESLCPKLKVIRDIEKYEEYYTDRNYRHGCYPWHLNDTMYKIIANEIRRITGGC